MIIKVRYNIGDQVSFNNNQLLGEIIAIEIKERNTITYTVEYWIDERLVSIIMYERQLQLASEITESLIIVTGK